MLVLFLLIIAADTKIIHDCNSLTPLINRPREKLKCVNFEHQNDPLFLFYTS